MFLDGKIVRNFSNMILKHRKKLVCYSGYDNFAGTIINTTGKILINSGFFLNLL
jgi:hypothetical protein